MLSDKNILNPHNWVGAHADYLYAYTRARINDEEQARDLVQETFLAALERIGAFEGRSSERTWLTAILRNKIIDVYRKRSSGLRSVEVKQAEEEQTDFFDHEYGHWNSEPAPKPFGIDEYEPLRSKEFDHILSQCLGKLPALWMSVFTMKHLDDESTEAICSELKLTSSNFWVIIHRAKLNLRACLQKNWI
ncbi:MAG TPA: sigma-70 family RNA polymerase sigma factor [Mucilaginibacter sp.]|nr:sigma-70 family RNA polymerase sigma factor [Mucilaginibacter sp.]